VVRWEVSPVNRHVAKVNGIPAQASVEASPDGLDRVSIFFPPSPPLAESDSWIFPETERHS